MLFLGMLVPLMALSYHTHFSVTTIKKTLGLFEHSMKHLMNEVVDVELQIYFQVMEKVLSACVLVKLHQFL